MCKDDRRQFVTAAPRSVEAVAHPDFHDEEQLAELAEPDAVAHAHLH
ncbi:MAG: hypothetical protein IPM35_23520 [Myxococcales bacterium]|nr:hypothetical protein [Myxococcales bacterium]